MDWQNAIFAPGWVWSMLSMVLVVGSLVGLYRQLRLQRNAADIEQLAEFQDEWSSERLVRHKLSVLTAIRDGAHPANVPFGSAYALADFYEKVGSLVRIGRIDATLLHNASGAACVPFWMTLAPFVGGIREVVSPQTHEHFEWLSGVMSAMERRAGAPTWDAAHLASWREAGIAIYEDQLRVEQSLRTVIVASPEAVPAAPAATAAAAEG
jgi:hypothetical protein